MALERQILGAGFSMGLRLSPDLTLKPKLSQSLELSAL